MRKKYLALVLVLALAFAFLAGCGKKEDTSAGDTATEEQVEETTEGEEEASSTTEEEAPKEEIQLCIGNYYYGSDHGSSYDSYMYFDGSSSTIEMKENAGYKALGDAIKSFSDELLESFKKECDNLAESAKEYYDPDDSNTSISSNYNTITPARVDSHVVSLSIENSSYGGGAHGYYSVVGATFDSETGKELALKDLGIDTDELEEYIVNFIKKSDYKDAVFDEYRTTIHDDLNGDFQTWYLTGDKLMIIFNPYEITPYAAGQVAVAVPLADLKNIDSKYMPVGKELYQATGSTEFDIDGHKVGLEINYNDDGYSMTGSMIVNGKKICKVLDGDYFYSYKVIHYRNENGDDYIIVTVTGDNDYSITELYKVDDEKVVLADTMNGSSFKNINEHSFAAVDRVDVLGTYSCDRRYAIANDKFEPVDEMYVIEDSDPKYKEYRKITVLKDIKVRIGEEDNFTDSTLKKGTNLYITYTDGKSIVGFETEEGEKGNFDITKEKDGYGIKIDGIDQNEVFDNLPYAG